MIQKMALLPPLHIIGCNYYTDIFINFYFDTSDSGWFWTQDLLHTMLVC
jgi:hypothetical protein